MSLALGALFAGFILAAAFNLGLIWATVAVIGLYVAWANAREKQP